jgi:hypothetical protein
MRVNLPVFSAPEDFPAPKAESLKARRTSQVKTIPRKQASARLADSFI